MHNCAKQPGRRDGLARPAKWRCLECVPGSKLFGPVGVPARQLEKVRISFDELEALRLLHLEGATQAEAGSRLGVSGSTVSRMADRAHRLITEALVADKAICVEGGPVTVVRVSESENTAARGIHRERVTKRKQEPTKERR